MAQIIKPTTQSGWLCYINGLEIFFTSFSGISDSADTSTYPSGTGNRILPLIGPRTISEVTLATPHDPATSQDIEELWQEYACESLTVTIQPLDCAGESVGQPYILDGVLLSGISLGEVNRDSSEANMIELTLQPSTWRRG